MRGSCALRDGWQDILRKEGIEMTEMLLRLLAYGTLVAFLAILWIWVPRLDLAIILGATAVLAAIDLFLHSRSG